MINNLDILYGVTSQYLTFTCPEGVPTSITSTVFENSDGDDSTAEAATTGSPEASLISTTFDGSAGDAQADPLVLPIADTTGIVIGARYLVTDATGETEWVEARELTAGVSIGVRHNLRNDYVTGDTFEGTQITHALESAWVADKNNISPTDPNPRYRWRLEYTVDCIVRVQHIYFDLVRYSGTTTVTGLDVDGAYPWLGWLNKLPVEDIEDRGARIISEAYRQVKLKLAMAGKADEAARNREVIEDLVIHKAAYLVAGQDVDALEVIDKNFHESFNNFIVVPKIEFDADGTGAAAVSDPSPVWIR